MNSGCAVHLLATESGQFTGEQVRMAVKADDVHYPVSKLVAIENTCNKGGGSIWDASRIDEVRAVCVENNLKLHLDGARLFNALIETGQSTQSVGAQFDSISICLSKGLGCPVGSLLLGDASFIKQARRVRKVFGGGMRQAGYLASAGIYALDYNIERLKEDHNLAKSLAQILSRQSWVESVIEPQTNIVVAILSEPNRQAELLEALKQVGILAVGFGVGRIRFVTHLDIPAESLNLCETAFQKIK
jgi:threonine aldolase